MIICNMLITLFFKHINMKILSQVSHFTGEKPEELREEGFAKVTGNRGKVKTGSKLGHESVS